MHRARRRAEARDRLREALAGFERRVAAAVSRGASNREIAAELFLAPKTVEFHLGQLYRKLGVGSRAQLVAALARGPATTTGHCCGDPCRGVSP